MAAQEHKGQREHYEMREGQNPHEGSQARSQKFWVLEQCVGLGVLFPTYLSCDNEHGRHRFIDAAKKPQQQQENPPKTIQKKNPKQNPTKKPQKHEKAFA